MGRQSVEKGRESRGGLRRGSVGMRNERPERDNVEVPSHCIENMDTVAVTMLTFGSAEHPWLPYCRILALSPLTPVNS